MPSTAASAMDPPLNRRQIVIAAIVFEGAIGLFAWGAGHLVEIPIEEITVWNPNHLGRGTLAALPALFLLLALIRIPSPPLVRLRNFVRSQIVPLFRECSAAELLLIAVLAGIGEEMLFRGVIQHGLAERIGPPSGMIIGITVASVLFALAHALTWTYALLAGLISVYFGWLLAISGNLLVPIAAHAAYDFLAFVYLLRFERPAELPPASLNCIKKP
jgi:membrane protease YdiL (CAAX protease family)